MDESDKLVTSNMDQISTVTKELEKFQFLIDDM